MKRRLSHLLLALVLAWTLCCAALAYTQGSTANFVPQKSYAGQFVDVPQNAWYAAHVATLYEYGLTTGTAASTYSPNAPVSLCEAATFAARILHQYETGETLSVHADGGAWYSGYVSFLKAESSLGTEFDGLWTQPATRAQVAHLLANLLPTEALPLRYDELITQAYALTSYIPDVDDNTPWQSDIIRLYKLGLVNGTDAQGSYQPDRTITRAELAAILTRILDPSLRVTLDFTPTPASKLTSYGALVTAPAQLPTAPRSDEELDTAIRWMLANEGNTLVLRYGKDEIDSASVNELLQRLTEVITCYCEQMYNYVSCQYTPSTGRVELSFSSMAVSGESLSAYREASLQVANQVHDTLWETGALNAAMTQTQKAKVYLQWLCEHCRYDYNASDSSLSHTAYGALIKGVAVCDGYVGAYHLLLATEGISCRAECNDTHIWTQTTLDGQSCYIDPTWVDVDHALRWQYFGMSEEVSDSVHGM